MNRDMLGRFSSSVWERFVRWYDAFFSHFFWAVVMLVAFTVWFEKPAIEPITVVEVVHAESKNELPPILVKIAECESGNTHIDPKTGQVLTMGNNNKTVDIGRYQINEHYWGSKATELGLLLTDEQDNEAMAVWILENEGTWPWSASADCWH